MSVQLVWLQRVEGLLVEPTAFATEELALDGVAHELVAEAEPVVLLLDQEAAVDQRPEVGDQLVLGPVTERRQDVEPRPGAEDRGGLDDAALVGRQPVELAADELGERPRQGPVGERLRIGVAGGAEDLLEEERVAAGAAQQRLGHPRARRVARRPHRRTRRSRTGRADRGGPGGRAGAARGGRASRRRAAAR